MLALDHPAHVERLAVLDIVPTAEAWQRADAQFATAFWPWSLLAQPEPLPERLLAAAPNAVIGHALGAWGTCPDVFDAESREAYIQALSNPASVHAICEEYRAAATLDVQHDPLEERRSHRVVARRAAAVRLSVSRWRSSRRRSRSRTRTFKTWPRLLGALTRCWRWPCPGQTSCCCRHPGCLGLVAVVQQTERVI